MHPTLLVQDLSITEMAFIPDYSICETMVTEVETKEANWKLLPF